MSYPKAGFAWLVVSRRQKVSSEFKYGAEEVYCWQIDWFNVVASM